MATSHICDIYWKKETKNKKQDVKYMDTTILISLLSVEIVSYGSNGNKGKI